MKRVLSLILCVALVVPGVVFAIPDVTYAAEDPYNNTFYFAQPFYDGVDAASYTDEVFLRDSREYDIQLLNMSYDLITNIDEVPQYLENTGFTDVFINEDFMKDPPVMDSSGLVCARKTIVDDGKKYTLIAMVPDGGSRDGQYDQILRFNNRGNSAGIQAASDKVIDSLREYVNESGITGDVKIWIMGYSRTASIMNLAAAEMLKDPKQTMSESVDLTPDNLYGYMMSGFKAISNEYIAEDLEAGYDFDGIHNICDPSDMSSNMPGDGFGMGLYGQITGLIDSSLKDRALEIMKVRDQDYYDTYVNYEDPDGFTPFKVDSVSLLDEGQLSLVPDEDSYIPKEMSEYLNCFGEYMDEVYARASRKGDSREGYFLKYQQPLRRIMAQMMAGNSDSNVGTGSVGDNEMLLPLIISMYALFVVDKAARDGTEDCDGAIENAFNALAYIIEDGTGSIRSRFQSLSSVYSEILEKMFTIKSPYKYKTAPKGASIEDDEDLVLADAPEKYGLILRCKSDGDLMVELMGDLCAAIYEQVLRNSLSPDIDSDTLRKLTSDGDTHAISYLLANMLFGNNAQSKVSIADFSFENQYFKQMATLMGNYSRLFALHYRDNIIPWLRAQDPFFDDYDSRPDEAQSAGYRRVYIDQPEGMSLTGTISDENGIVAEFENGIFTSRSDKWIGFTSSDEGTWLRLPIDKTYDITLTAGDSGEIKLRVAAYSVEEGKIVGEDSGVSWNAVSLDKGGSAAFSLPKLEKTEDGYVLEDATISDLDVTVTPGPVAPVTPGSKDSAAPAANSSVTPSAQMVEQYDAKLAKVKKFKAKAGNKSLTVKWKKLTKAQKSNVGNIEVQYSTSKNFTAEKTKTKVLSKSKSKTTIKKLSKGKKYYVRVRTVRTEGNIKYVSKWTKVKKVKVK